MARDEGMTFHINIYGFAGISDQLKVSQKGRETTDRVSAAEGEKCSYSICANTVGSHYQTHELLSTRSPEHPAVKIAGTKLASFPGYFI